MIKEGVGKHSADTDGIFWQTLFLSILKWIAIPIIPILAIIGGWNWLSDRNTAGSEAEDNPAMIDTTGGTSSPSPDSTPGSELLAAQILNGSGNPQSLAAAQRKLQDAGYEIVTTGNASRSYENTTVFFQEGHKAQADELASLAGASVTEPAPGNLDKNIPLALILGADFNT